MLVRWTPLYLVLTVAPFSSSLVSLLGGSGVPPGTKPETCRRCKGSGVVSTSLLISTLYFQQHACFFVYNVGSFYLIFSIILCSQSRKLVLSHFRRLVLHAKEQGKSYRYDILSNKNRVVSYACI